MRHSVNEYTVCCLWVPCTHVKVWILPLFAWALQQGCSSTCPALPFSGHRKGKHGGVVLGSVSEVSDYRSFLHTLIAFIWGELLGETNWKGRKESGKEPEFGTSTCSVCTFALCEYIGRHLEVVQPYIVWNSKIIIINGKRKSFSIFLVVLNWPFD